jgi:hypothetical protein
MASVEAIGEPGARRRRRGGRRGSGRREGAKSMRVPSFCNCIQVGEDGWGCQVGWQCGGQAELTRTDEVSEDDGGVLGRVARGRPRKRASRFWDGQARRVTGLRCSMLGGLKSFSRSGLEVLLGFLRLAFSSGLGT